MWKMSAGGMSFSSNKLCIPKGLPVLLEKLALEVLRNQPADVVQFSSLYFNELLNRRETTGVDPCEQPYEDDTNFKETIKLKPKQVVPPSDAKSDANEDAAAKLIQRRYKNHKAGLDIKKKKAATKIQAGYRGYLTRKQLKAHNISEPKQTSKGATGAGTDDNQKENAAVTIQATYRGFKTRKVVKKRRIMQEKSVTKIQANYRGYRARREVTRQRKHNTAAVKIQKNYRGYITRKRLSESKMEPVEK